MQTMFRSSCGDVFDVLHSFNDRPTSQPSRHLQRLQDSAHALAFKAIPSTEEITVAIMATLAANNMVDGVHARVTLTRGTKTTSSMNPEFNVFG